MTRKRVEAATALLTGTRLSIAEIARRMGYTTQAHFCTVVRRVTGKTPSQVRAAARASGAAQPH
jgi:two-component system response regulator YesN